MVSYETVLKFLRTPKTAPSLRVRALLDKSTYQIGLELTAEQKAQINLFPHRVLLELNYTIKPRDATS